MSHPLSMYDEAPTDEPARMLTELEAAADRLNAARRAVRSGNAPQEYATAANTDYLEAWQRATRAGVSIADCHQTITRTKGA